MNALIILTDILEKTLLVGLVGLSIWSISIIIECSRRFKKESQFSFENFRDCIDRSDWTGADKMCLEQQLSVQKILHKMLAAKNVFICEKEMNSAFKKERLSLETGFAVLATLGANAPFIGLLGTVLGIIRAFAYLGSQAGTTAVMSGVSQALYATAVGLAVAIPAVIAYNIFTKKMRDLQIELESLKDLIIARKMLVEKAESCQE